MSLLHSVWVCMKMRAGKQFLNYIIKQFIFGYPIFKHAQRHVSTGDLWQHPSTYQSKVDHRCWWLYVFTLWTISVLGCISQFIPCGLTSERCQGGWTGWNIYRKPCFLPNPILGPAWKEKTINTIKSDSGKRVNMIMFSILNTFLACSLLGGSLVESRSEIQWAQPQQILAIKGQDRNWRQIWSCKINIGWKKNHEFLVWLFTVHGIMKVEPTRYSAIHSYTLIKQNQPDLDISIGCIPICSHFLCSPCPIYLTRFNSPHE